VREVAKEEGVPLLEMEDATRELVKSFGPEGSRALYQHFEPGEQPRLPDGRHDDTHFSALEARLVAGWDLDGCRRSRPRSRRARQAVRCSFASNGVPAASSASASRSTG
jgi:hypothetical protein